MTRIVPGWQLGPLVETAGRAMPPRVCGFAIDVSQRALSETSGVGFVN